jgi:HJR/Mrr/RecB family endonuclease
MSILSISQDEFDSLNIERLGFLPERAWYRSTEIDLAGVIVRDPFDNDWAYVLLSKEEDGVYRYFDGEHSLPDQESADSKLHTSANLIETKGFYEEEFYSREEEINRDETNIFITTIDDEIKRHLKNNPEELYQLSSRQFEELVASILKDMGFDVELTQATRDGGRDIIAYVRNAVCSYLTHIECKRYAPKNTVGVGIIREVIGVHHLRKATKSIIVTTSFFSKDAIKEAEIMENQLDLKNFNDIKDWLQKY